MPRVRTVAAVAAAIVAGITATPRAHAATGVHYGLTDDAWLTSGPGSVDDRVATLHTLGVGVVRYTLHWDQIAKAKPATATDPEDPAYDWTPASTVIDALHAQGMQVLLQLDGTPGWANGHKSSNWLPTSSSSFAAFATAAAREYPWVKKWLIWNEPNQARWLRPTSPVLYVVRLLNPAYVAIHAAIKGAQVAGGGTAPRASTGGVSPVAWLNGMHAARARLDAYAHNPYPLDPKRESPLSGGCTTCTTITMSTIGKLVTLVARNFPRARIWLTEYGYQTYPPDRLLGVSYALQAKYVSEGAYAAYHTPRVDLLIHFLYKDEPQLARFQSGLVTLANKAKPSLAAFQLPLAQTARTGTRTSLWGQVRAPGTPATATIERKVGSVWRRVATVRAGGGRFFRWTGTLPRGSSVRLHAGTLVGAPLAIT